MLEKRAVATYVAVGERLLCYVKHCASCCRKERWRPDSLGRYACHDPAVVVDGRSRLSSTSMQVAAIAARMQLFCRAVYVQQDDCLEDFTRARQP